MRHPFLFAAGWSLIALDASLIMKVVLMLS